MELISDVLAPFWFKKKKKVLYTHTHTDARSFSLPANSNGVCETKAVFLTTNLLFPFPPLHC